MRVRTVFAGIAVVTVLAAALLLASPALNSRNSTSLMAVATNVAPMAAPGETVADGYYAYDEAERPQDVLVRQERPLQDRVVLKNAVMTLVVDDVDAKIAEITALASEYAGWVVNAQVSRTRVGEENRVSYGTITIRVDANQLDAVLALIKQNVSNVEAESVTGQDVTQDYVDLSGQVANLEAAERQLQAIMNDASKTEDVLSVYNELVRVRGEIETLRGRLNYYDEASRTSSIQVTLRPTPVIQPVEIAGWRPLETARDAFQTLVNLLQGAADVVITVAIVGIPLGVALLIPVLVLRRLRQRTARAAA